eukprot:Gb_19379 [translate_table: standard]
MDQGCQCWQGMYYSALKAIGVRAIMIEIDPICALQTLMERIPVLALEEVVETVDIFMTTIEPWGMELISLYSGCNELANNQLPLVYLGSNSSSANPSNLCLKGSLDPKVVKGKIVSMSRFLNAHHFFVENNSWLDTVANGQINVLLFVAAIFERSDTYVVCLAVDRVNVLEAVVGCNGKWM